jgi:hypothetical protein
VCLESVWLESVWLESLGRLVHTGTPVCGIRKAAIPLYLRCLRPWQRAISFT